MMVILLSVDQQKKTNICKNEVYAKQYCSRRMNFCGPVLSKVLLSRRAFV